MASNAKNAENDAAPSTPKAGSGGGYSSLTAREQEILAKAMTCLKTAPEVSICNGYNLVLAHKHPSLRCAGFCFPVSFLATMFVVCRAVALSRRVRQ